MIDRHVELMRKNIKQIDEHITRIENWQSLPDQDNHPRSETADEFLASSRQERDQLKRELDYYINQFGEFLQ